VLDSPARSVPAATASASGTCTVPDSDPKVARLVAPVLSEAMRARNKAGVVDVSVFLGSDGSIAKAVVSRSSGDDLLDAATYAAATATTYEPEVKNCAYLSGTYIFRARFRAEPRAATGAPAAATEPPPFAPQTPPTPVASLPPPAAPSPGPAPSPAPSPVATPTAR
jgi:TonB family protein